METINKPNRELNLDIDNAEANEPEVPGLNKEQEDEQLMIEQAINCCNCNSLKLFLCNMQITNKKTKLMLFCDSCGCIQTLLLESGLREIPKPTTQSDNKQLSYLG